MAPLQKIRARIVTLRKRGLDSGWMVKIKTEVEWFRVRNLLLAVAFLFLIGLAIGYFIRFPGLSGSRFKFKLSAPSLPEARSSTQSSWTVYTHPTAAYSFRYPEAWKVEEEASTSAVSVLLIDPRFSSPQPIPRLVFAVASNLPKSSGAVPTVFGDLVGSKIKLSSDKEPLREGYLIELSSDLTLLVKTAPPEAGFDYQDVYTAILSTLTSEKAEVKKEKKPAPAEVTLTAQQRGDHLQFRLHVASGAITRVRFYANDDLLYEVPARDLGGSSLPTTFEAQSEATKLSRQWLQTEKTLANATYIFRHHRDWTGTTETCLPSRGYLHIFVAGGKYYDVRLSEDSSQKKVCFEGEGVQVEENWYYLTKKPSSGTYKLKATAYDAEGREVSAEIPRFQVR